MIDLRSAHGLGVTHVVSGYAGGDARTANYEAFGSGCTGHTKACHRDYLTQHPGRPYIVIHDVPKVGHLARWFPKQYRAEAVLVVTEGYFGQNTGDSGRIIRRQLGAFPHV